MTEAEHEEIVLTGEKTYYGVNCNANTIKQKAIDFEKNWFDREIAISDLLIEFATEVTKELQIENNSLSKRILELQGDKGRLLDEINDWKAKADKAYSEKANAEIKLNEAREIIKEYLEWADWKGSNCPSYASICEKAEAFLNKE